MHNSEVYMAIAISEMIFSDVCNVSPFKNGGVCFHHNNDYTNIHLYTINTYKHTKT